MMTTVRVRLRLEVPHLRRYARILTRSPGGADHLVRQCLKRALARYSRRNPDEDIRIWLFQILHNLHQPKWSGHAEPSTSPVFTGRDVSRYLEVVVQALECLPIEYREIVFLVTIERLTYEEAATVLGLSSRTVQARLSEAREALRQALQAALFPDDSRDAN